MSQRTALDVLRGVFGRFFPVPAFKPWVLACAAVFGLTYGLNAEELGFIAECLGVSVDQVPTSPASRMVFVVGRRGGKTRFAQFLAVHAACFRDYRGVLAPGERGVVMCICPDRRQSRVLFGGIEALIDGVPMLAAMVESRTKESIHLQNGISIEVHTASFRSVRGYTVVCAIVDEAAFLPTDDSAEPDSELVAALLPAMATVQGAQLILISSPYARRGELWKAYEQHFGKPGGPVLVWQASTRTMNMSVPQALIDQAYADDPASAAAEYGAEFRRDIEDFVSVEALERVRQIDRASLPRQHGVSHIAFCDPAGGSGGDSFPLAIGHEGPDGIAVLDLIIERRPPFSPDAVVEEFAAALKAYGVREVRGDRYAGEWPAERFRKHGIDYKISDDTKTEIYRKFLPLLNSARVELLDQPVLLKQLKRLERRTTRTGQEIIDHPPGSHDDVANAAAGVLVNVTKKTPVTVGRARIERWL